MSLLISLIVWLIVIGLVWWLVRMLPLPSPVGQIVHVVFIIFLIVGVLSVFGIVPGFNLPMVHL